jgi:peptidoglycan/xylan/chitin deacetylase (PgdA/CDA1 family)
MSSERKPLMPPEEGKKLIVHCVVNVEYWPFDQPMPRKALSVPHGMEPVPDIPNYCWAEYGLRCGMPRLLDLFEKLGLRASANLNSMVIDQYPSLAKAMLNAGWEFVAHGLLQRLLHREENEEAVIEQAIREIAAFTGKKVRGWMGPGFAQTFDTPDYLRKHGIDYNMDWVLDDLPCWMRTMYGPMICMPYAFELNDSLIYAVERQSSAELLNRVRDTIETFECELRAQPRVITLGLHPHQIAVPHRIGYLEKSLRVLKERDDAVFMTGSEIADWYARVAPDGDEERSRSDVQNRLPA